MKNKEIEDEEDEETRVSTQEDDAREAVMALMPKE